MSKLIIETTDYLTVLKCARDADPSAFFVGGDMMSVSGGRLTAKAGDGVVVVSSNHISEDQLQKIFAGFLSQNAGDEK